jgi:hypothetical protein
MTRCYTGDIRISEIIAAERFRRRVHDASDAGDIVQEVFYELVEANRLLMPIEHVTGWLFRVARNRITDLFRKNEPERFSDAAVEGEHGEMLHDYLPKFNISDGLDSWCPSCERVYCSIDFHVKAVFDDGMYDASWGTCPKGHERRLDDTRAPKRPKQLFSRLESTPIAATEWSYTDALKFTPASGCLVMS